MEYISFRKVLKVLKSPPGCLQIVDRTVFSEFFDINSMLKSLRDLKFTDSWMYMLIPPPPTTFMRRTPMSMNSCVLWQL